MNSNKKIYIVSGIIALGALTVAGFMFFNNFYGADQDMRDAKETRDVYLKPAGLNVEFIDLEIEGTEGEAIGERVIFERYRFFNTETNGEIDIRDENIRVFVAEPNGEEKEISTDNNYYLMQLYPGPRWGEYLFRLEMPDGAELAGSLEFSQPQHAPLIFIDEVVGAEGERLQVLEMSGLNLNDAESVFHVLRSNFVDYLSPNEDGYILVESAVLEVDNHVFLAKQDGIWHWAVHFNPVIIPDVNVK